MFVWLVGRALEDVVRVLEDDGRELEDGETLALEDELTEVSLNKALLKY